MEIKEIKVYNFKELEPAIKEKVIEKFREEEEFYFLKDDLTEFITNKLEELNYNIIELDVYYDLSYCQGSGAMFYGILEKDGLKYIIKHIGNYNHYNSKEITIYNIEDGEETEDIGFNDLYITLCKELEKYGYSIIEDTLKEENIIETIEANDYLFFYNGKIANNYI